MIMNITITKTSKQANKEKEKYKKESTCPECGDFPNIPIYYYESGLFRKDIKVEKYTCIKCYCEWEVSN